MGLRNPLEIGFKGPNRAEARLSPQIHRELGGQGIPAHDCHVCLTRKITLNEVFKYDPTRTKTIRDRFERESRKRIDWLVRVIVKAVGEYDVLGLGEGMKVQMDMTSDEAVAIIQRRMYPFMTSAQKVEGFMGWLNEMEERSILEVTHRPGAIRGTTQAWSDVYIRSAYQKGIARAQAELGYLDLDDLGDTGKRTVASAFAQPFHAERVGLLYTRVFEELKGVDAAMDQQISRVLSTGMSEGRGPRDMARMLRQTITGEGGEGLGITDILGRYIPAKRRAEMIARTETIRAHHQANINEYELAGVEGVKIQVEWSTAGYNVCPICAALQGKIFTLAQIRGMIPAHPSCRCTALPLPSLEAEKEKKKEEKSFEQKEPLMGTAKQLSNCISGIGITSNELIVNRPQSCTDYYREKDKWFLQGNEISKEEKARLDKLKIPPAWANVVVSKDPTAKIQVIGLDAASRWQYLYSAEHMAEAARKKFDKIKLFSRDIGGIRKNIESGIANGDTAAYLARLEDKTAIRIGTDKDFKAKTKAYGLTTLQNNHVKINGDKIVLDFTAKEGLPAHYELTDKTLASWLKERKAGLGETDALFPDVSAGKFNTYLKQIAGGKKYSAKDFRTYHASIMAREELKQYAGKPLSAKEKKTVIKKVSEKISIFLHNTPAMARNSYIDPMVWETIGGLP